MRRANLATVQPNPGHHALVELEQRLGDGFTLITQNVDGLHQLAGSKSVLEVHGALRRVRCTGCGRLLDRGTEALPDLPRCDECQALLRPDVVWFGEDLPGQIWARAERAAQNCQCLLVIGTSALVYPAAGLIDIAQACAAKVIEINATSTAATSSVDVHLQGSSGKILPDLLKRL
jgi:NAD-dependent deacetylase